MMNGATWSHHDGSNGDQILFVHAKGMERTLPNTFSLDSVRFMNETRYSKSSYMTVENTEPHKGRNNIK